MKTRRTSVRVADKESANLRGGGSRKCAACGENTREGKDYCSKHVTQLPYVESILGELEKRAVEIDAVRERGWRAVDLDGGNCTEVLRYLQNNGNRTLPRIRRDVFPNVEDEEVVAAYVEALRRANRVRTGATSRGWITVTLAPSVA